MKFIWQSDRILPKDPESPGFGLVITFGRGVCFSFGLWRRILMIGVVRV